MPGAVGRFGVGNPPGRSPQWMIEVPAAGPRFAISGVTRDSNGNVLGSCTVHLYRAATDQIVETVTSDASTGAYTFANVTQGDLYYVVAYLAGSPDVAGTTVRTIAGVQTNA